MSRTPTHEVDESNVSYPTAVTLDDDEQTILINRITWGAVAAGIVLSLVMQALLNLLGVGVGLGTVRPALGTIPQLRRSR